MLLHVGNDQMVFLKNIEFILDYDNLKSNNDSSVFLKKIEEKATVIHINKEDIKSAILLKKEGELFLYYSPISSKTLFKRSELNLSEYSISPGNFDNLKWDHIL